MLKHWESWREAAFLSRRFCRVSSSERKTDSLDFALSTIVPHSTRQGERSGHCRMASVAQALFLSAWHNVHGLGILYFSLIAGVTKANVCARTFTSEIVVSICGM